MNNLFKDTPYSETIGSFIRNGNYPLESHYIFPTEEALKEFYSDEVNQTTIHKGLLKIVENDGTGKQGLYWVTKKLTNEELEFTKLISGTNIDSIFEQLDSLETRLTEEIKNRADSEEVIWGTNDYSNLPQDLNSIYDLVETVIAIKLEILDIHEELIDSDDSIYHSLKTEVKTLAGTLEADVVEYLKTLPYRSLTEVALALDKFLNQVDDTTNQVNTLEELKAFLKGYTSADTLKGALENLYNEILGTPAPSQNFITLRAIEDFVRVFKAESENTDQNLQSELNQTQIGVGLSGDGSYNPDKETYYLKDATSVMNALKILDGLVNQAISGITIEASNNDVVDLNVRKELEGYVMSARLNLSNALGNDLIKKDDGLYFNITSTYNDGVLSLFVNDRLIAQHILGFSSIVDSAQYDPALEAIIIVFKLLNGEKQTINIPVGALIREWITDNSDPNKVVELVRENVIDGQDKVSADVRLWSDKKNILRKYGNTLGVEGTSENITHNDETLKIFLNNLKASITSSNTVLNNLIDSEVSRAKAKEAAIEESLALSVSDINGKIEEVNDDIIEVNNSIKAETNRATGEENALKTLIQDLKTANAEIRQVNELQSTQISALLQASSDTNHAINLETQRATNEESKLDRRLVAAEGELSKVSQEVAAKAEKSEIDALKTKYDENSEKLSQEIVRATQKEEELQQAITSLIATVTTKVNDNSLAILDLGSEVSKELAKKVGSVALEKVSDLVFNLIVDGVNAGQISIPEDLFLKSVSVINGSTLRFVFKTTTGVTITDINIEDIILEALAELEAKVNTKAPLDSPTFTGIPQVAQSPDLTDSSQRIPSTNWVNARILEEVAKVSTDIFYTKTEIRKMLSKKADLVDGIVPETQLPKLYIIEVE